MSDMDSVTHPSGEGATGASPSGESQQLDSKTAVAGVTLEDIEKLFDRKFQSLKDKRIGGIEKRIDDITARLAKDLEKDGYDPDEVKQVTDRLRNNPEPKSEPTTEKTPGKSDSGLPAEQILKAAGLESDDPDVTAFAQRTFTSDAEKVKEAILLAARRQSNPPAPKAPAPVTTSGQNTLESKTAELQAYLSSTTILDPKKVKALQEEINQLKQ